MKINSISYFNSQSNRWSTGEMLRNRESFSESEWQSFSPCPCSRSSAFSHTCHCWHLVEQSHSRSTNRSCQQFKRLPMVIHSSEFLLVMTNFAWFKLTSYIFCREILDFDLTLSPEKVQHFAGIACTHFNAYVGELRRLFLVEDLVDSLKFGLLLYLLTYIGAIFNGMTVVILGKITILQHFWLLIFLIFICSHS